MTEGGSRGAPSDEPRTAPRDNETSERGGGSEYLSAERLDASELLLTAFGFALLGAGLELFGLAVRKYGFGEFVWVSRRVGWMAPLAYLLVFAAAASVLLLLRRRIPVRILDMRTSVVLFGSLAFLGVLLVFGEIHRAAAVLLALGLGSVVARWSMGRPEAFRRWRRRLSGGLAAAFCLLAIGTEAALHLERERSDAELPAARPGAPDVLLIILDTVRAASTSLYGHALPTTPELERFAEEGVVFERAIAPSPWTLPTHASLFTGRHPHELSADWERPLDDEFPTLAEAFAADGYRTAAFVANLAYATYEHGLDRGFSRYEDYEITPAQLALSSSLGRSVTNNPTVRSLLGVRDVLNRKRAEHVLDRVGGWIDRRSGERPYFAFVNLYDAHEPYLPPPPFDWVSDSIDADRAFSYYVNEAWRTDKWELDARGLATERLAYEGSIAYLDHHLGRFLDGLGRRGRLENTVVVVASDHGEHFGEHGLVDHGNSLYLPLLRVPLLLTGPGVPEGRRVPDLVNLRQLPRTLAELAGLASPGTFPGPSLRSTWTAGQRSAGVSRFVLAEVSGGVAAEQALNHEHDLTAVVGGGHHYIRNSGGGEELYSLACDPDQNLDLARLASHREALEAFRSQAALMRAPEVHRIDWPGLGLPPDPACPELGLPGGP